jgi:hypothetical protein
MRDPVTRVLEGPADDLDRFSRLTLWNRFLDAKTTTRQSALIGETRFWTSAPAVADRAYDSPNTR